MTLGVEDEGNLHTRALMRASASLTRVALELVQARIHRHLPVAYHLRSYFGRRLRLLLFLRQDLWGRRNWLRLLFLLRKGDFRVLLLELFLGLDLLRDRIGGRVVDALLFRREIAKRDIEFHGLRPLRRFDEVGVRE